jgi:DNA (cytosine-5)-methyltransferase 1
MKNSYITVTDQFCGAGGSSQGIRNLSKEKGGGIEVKLALNHWKLAIETHNTNFPDTLHDCTDISACDPRRYPSTNILITSPECTNHSLAKGKKRKWQQQIEMFGKAEIQPEEERSRATMWDVPRFAEFHNYEIIIVENVVDARYWVTWDAWLKAMHSLGYKHKCVYINSMHCFPTPQSRDRMYIVFWKKGNKAPDLEFTPISWCTKCEKDIYAFQYWKNQEKKWGKYNQQYVYKCPLCNTIVEPYYYAAFNIIDWSVPGTRIGDRKTPLSPNTIRRINYGREKYWISPQIITTRYTSGIDCRVKSAIDSPLPTQPGDRSHALLNPLLIKRNHNTSLGSLVKDSIIDPLPTQLTDNGLHILSPLVMNGEYGENGKKVREALNDPLFTQTTRAANGIVMPFIVENYGQSKSKKISDPIGALLGKVKHGILSPESFKAFLTYYYNGSDVASSITDPARTFSTKDRVSLVIGGKVPDIEDCYYRMLLPHEVQLGMAFDSDYIVLGNGKEKVKQLGNAVTPPVMKWLSKQCIASLE